MTADQKPQKRATHVVAYNRPSAADQMRKNLERLKQEKEPDKAPKSESQSK